MLASPHVQLLEVEQQVTGVKEHLVGRGGNYVRDLPGSFNMPESKESRVVCNGMTNQLCTFSLTLVTKRTKISSSLRDRLNTENKINTTLSLQKTGPYLCSDNCTSLVLLRFLNNELGTLSLLGSNLLGFNGMSKLLSKAQACDGHIIKSNIKVSCSLCQYLPDLSTHSLELVGKMRKNIRIPKQYLLPMQRVNHTSL
jgi:hypothetical protein